MNKELVINKEPINYTKDKSNYLGLRCTENDIRKVLNLMKVTEQVNKSETVRFCISYCYEKAQKEQRGIY